MGNTPCCEASGASKPPRSVSWMDEDSSDGSSDSDDGGKLSIDVAALEPGTPSAAKGKGGRTEKSRKKAATNANLTVEATDRSAMRRKSAMRREAQTQPSDSDSSSDGDSSGGSSTGGEDSSDDEGSRTPTRNSSRPAEPLGAPRGKKTNSFLDDPEDEKKKKKKKNKKKKGGGGGGKDKRKGRRSS